MDGGGARNDFLMQFQADLLGIPIDRPQDPDTIPRGAAFAAGFAVGYWESMAEATNTVQRNSCSNPPSARTGGNPATQDGQKH